MVRISWLWPGWHSFKKELTYYTIWLFLRQGCILFNLLGPPPLFYNLSQIVNILQKKNSHGECFEWGGLKNINPRFNWIGCPSVVHIPFGFIPAGFCFLFVFVFCLFLLCVLYSFKYAVHASRWYNSRETFCNFLSRLKYF